MFLLTVLAFAVHKSQYILNCIGGTWPIETFLLKYSAVFQSYFLERRFLFYLFCANVGRKYNVSEAIFPIFFFVELLVLAKRNKRGTLSYFINKLLNSWF